MKRCFVISPIGESGSEIRNRSDEILTHIIRPVLIEFDYKALRADEISESGLITNQIFEHIVFDDLVICDMTFRNPNVYYELAIRHMVQKPIIQIIDENEEMPFDVINTRTIKINHRSRSGADVAKNRIREYLHKIKLGKVKIETPTSSVIDLDVALFDKSPISNLNRTYSKIYNLLKGTGEFINPLGAMTIEEYGNEMGKIDSLRSSFLANLSHEISHEIRTPINGILGYTALLTDNTISHKKRTEYGLYLKQVAHRLVNEMNDLFDLSIIETNRINVQIKESDITSSMDNIYQHYIKNLNDINSKIILKLLKPQKPILDFKTDLQRIEQIIKKLIDNAIKFTNKGNIEIAYELINTEFYCSVKDTGIGISIRDYQIIFEKFRKVNVGIDIPYEYEGMGIGLSIAKGLVEKLGGRIWVESKLKKGTTFYFSIPSLIN